MTNAEYFLKSGVSVEEVAQELEQAIYKRATENLNKVIVDYFNKEISVLTEDERVILRNLYGDGFQFEKILRRDWRLIVRGYENIECVIPFSQLFQFIKERRRILY